MGWVLAPLMLQEPGREEEEATGRQTTHSIQRPRPPSHWAWLDKSTQPRKHSESEAAYQPQPGARPHSSLSSWAELQSGVHGHLHLTHASHEYPALPCLLGWPWGWGSTLRSQGTPVALSPAPQASFCTSKGGPGPWQSPSGLGLSSEGPSSDAEEVPRGVGGQ